MPKLVAILTAVAASVAGCGGSSSSKPNRQAAASFGLRFAACMRSNGVPNFPDPSGGGGGIHIPANSGIDPASPAFQGAQKACRKLLPGGGPPTGPPSAQEKLQMVRLSECMRAHGVADFPDPTTSPPSNPSGFSVAFGRPGLFIAVPKTINLQSPAFVNAAKVCQFPAAH